MSEVAGEIYLIYEDSDKDSAPNRSSKKQRSNLPKWKRSHISPLIDLLVDKHESGKQLLLRKSPNLVGASEWTVFLKVFQNMLEHRI